MQISKIEPYDNKKFSKIYVDGEYILSLANEIVIKKNLTVGSSIDDEELISLNEAACVRRARERMLYSLDRRLHSEKELRDKLRRDYPPKIIDKAIEELRKLRLIDDKKFAIAFCEHRKNVQKKGPYLISRELFAKGVSREIIDEAIGEIFEDSDSELESAKDALSKYAHNINDEKVKKRAFATLVRKGFSINVVKAAMREITEIEEYCD